LRAGIKDAQKTDGTDTAEIPGTIVRPGVSPVMMAADDDDDWWEVRGTFNEIPVQRARMNNRPCG